MKTVQAVRYACGYDDIDGNNTYKSSILAKKKGKKNLEKV